MPPPPLFMSSNVTAAGAANAAASTTVTVTTASGIKLPMTAAMARSSGISLRTGRPKRKKASRACFHCQKAHLTCDDARPCQRCIKRGLQSTCQDGVRKKAKYLHDASPEQRQTDKPSKKKLTSTTTTTTTATTAPAPGTIDPSSLTQDGDSPSDSLFSNLDLSGYDFGSRTANLEYSYLSNMIGDNSNTNHSTISHAINQMQSSVATQDPLSPVYSSYSFADMSVRDSNWASRGLASLLSANDPNYNNSPQNSNSPPTPSSITPQVSSFTATNTATLSSAGPLIPTGLPSHLGPRSRSTRRVPESVYASVTQPFSYTPGYHDLISYLKSRFDRPHLMRVARCMAAFRPSFIACTKTLKEEDLIFMEKCFQRTLFEYEKFISYSGTPTIVWRRTGQVAAVGKEFCILTGWTKDELLGKRTFVVELMDDHSVLEYFEGFSKLAFGDSRGATMMECTLLGPTGRKIPTACTWTIKRDVFDIPMMIVGNFLPILN
ncbi:hypothetical protein V1514DRAFT_308283 [Lipomyces japonicus]|uniref:uncharacterized protein n=1 Tax=Lipomyces japonicus TaxID=56871 RepID=UPI0034CED5EB